MYGFLSSKHKTKTQKRRLYAREKYQDGSISKGFLCEKIAQALKDHADEIIVKGEK